MNALAAWVELSAEKDHALAQKVGVSRVQIYRIRTGASKPSPKVAEKLSVITGIPAWEFLRPDAPKPEAA